MPMESTLLCKLQIIAYPIMHDPVPHNTCPLREQFNKNLRAHMPAATTGSIQHVCGFNYATVRAGVSQWFRITRLAWFHLRESMCIDTHRTLLLLCQPIMHQFVPCRHLRWHYEADMRTDLPIYPFVLRIQRRSHLCHGLCWWVFCRLVDSQMRVSMSYHYTAIWGYLNQLLRW